uniref:Uncharacterized protein n=1 Tax=Anguilla anguilla TaxID=7936 RepID=A0A0E9XGZ5_ANGAN
MFTMYTQFSDPVYTECSLYSYETVREHCVLNSGRTTMAPPTADNDMSQHCTCGWFFFCSIFRFVLESQDTAFFCQGLNHDIVYQKKNL